ncbi:hypothetical protein [Vannielia sp. SX4]|uniref:hypothetical protein n=1 Tax=Vannielia sp. SX4 TaxID=3463852 RepID=UPI0040596B38
MKIESKLKKRLMTAGSVFAIALGTGFVMQQVGPMADAFTDDAPQEVVSKAPADPAGALQPLSSARQERTAAEAASQKRTAPTEATEARFSAPAPAEEEAALAPAPQLAKPAEQPAVGVTRSASVLPMPALQSRTPSEPVPEAAAAPATGEATDTGETETAQDCTVSLSAKPQPAAMVRLALTAPCNPGELVTFTHGPLTFTEVTNNEGGLVVDVPALAANASFEASFPLGERATALALVPGVDDFNRTALSWEGTGGVALHAFENGAEFGTEGHVDASAPAGPSRATAGEGGFITLLGAADAPRARMAEVYSYPLAAGGSVSLTVEAEVTAANCGREVQAKVLRKGADGFAPHALSVTMPGCEAEGEFLVFSGILPEIRLASAE